MHIREVTSRIHSLGREQWTRVRNREYEGRGEGRLQKTGIRGNRCEREIILQLTSSADSHEESELC